MTKFSRIIKGFNANNFPTFYEHFGYQYSCFFSLCWYVFTFIIHISYTSGLLGRQKLNGMLYTPYKPSVYVLIHYHSSLSNIPPNSKDKETYGADWNSFIGARQKIEKAAVWCVDQLYIHTHSFRHTQTDTHSYTQDTRTPRRAAVQAKGPEREDEKTVYSVHERNQLPP